MILLINNVPQVELLVLLHPPLSPISQVESPVLLNFALSRRLLALLLPPQISFHLLPYELPDVLEGHFRRIDRH